MREKEEEEGEKKEEKKKRQINSAQPFINTTTFCRAYII